tara:strand:- start:182 stop:370 length:189 start_codon:yes stop_codon:yes gene_type:complete
MGFSVVLRKEDFKEESVWEFLLEGAGIQTSTIVAGRRIDNEFEELDFTPANAKASASRIYRR